MSKGTVTSADGTRIAYERQGNGDPVIVVNTVAEDRSGLSGLAGLLAQHFTVYTYDRRGRGDSGDTKPYAPEREVEDLAALIEVAGHSGSLISGSAGCVLCLDAATALGDSVHSLYLFEPPFIVNDSRPPMPADNIKDVESLVAAGDRSAAVEYLRTKAMLIPAEFVGAMKADPSWTSTERYAHARVQLCGTFAVELSGRRIDHLLPGRQGRLLFAYLVLSRLQPVSRGALIDALWDDAPPADAGGALNALISKTRAVVDGDVVRGRTELTLALPEPAHVDVEVAFSMLHAAESAVAVGEWQRAWSPALSALLVAQRTLLPEAEAPWVEVWRRRLADVRLRALECYAKTCLELGGTELPGAERAARELVDVAPLRESGHLLLMRALAASGNVAEALAAYARLRVLLREELGVDPSEPVQEAYVSVLR